MLQNDLIKIKNAYMAGHKEVSVRQSRLTYEVCEVLSKHKYIGRIRKVEKEPAHLLNIELLYTKGVPHLHEVTFFSKPGRRLYRRSSELRRVRQGYGDFLLSTSKGIKTAEEARKEKVGGELLCEVF